MKQGKTRVGCWEGWTSSHQSKGSKATLKGGGGNERNFDGPSKIGAAGRTGGEVDSRFQGRTEAYLTNRTSGMAVFDKTI